MLLYSKKWITIEYLMKIISNSLLLSLCGVILVSGLLSLYQNKVQLLPDVEPPKISFSVVWPGATEDYLVSDVVKPYESAIIGKLSHFKQLLVITEAEKANFSIEFDFGTDLNQVEVELDQILSRARALPLNIKPISFHQGGRNVSNRVVGSYFITSSSGAFNEKQTRFLNDFSAYRLGALRGIDRVELNPNLDSSVIIKIDMVKLYQLNLSFEQVRRAIKGILVQPVTKIYENEKIITAQFKRNRSLVDIKNIPLLYVDNIAVILSDISEVTIAPVIKTAVARFNGVDAIAMRVLRKSSANLVEVQTAVDNMISDNQSAFSSAGLKVNLSFDTSIFIKRSIIWIAGSLLSGLLLSLIVSFWFFRSIQPTILSVLVTVLSMSCVFVLLYLTGTSINVISLAGITFSIGMFVDGVLILIEYIDKIPKNKKSTPSEVWQVIKKLIPALSASLFTTVVIFIPVIFSQGGEGELFSGLSIAIVSGLIFSFAFTLLITPHFVSRFMVKGNSNSEALFPKILMSLLVRFNSKANSLIIISVLILGSLVGIVTMLPPIDYLPSVKRDAVDVYIPLSGQNTINKIEREVLTPLSLELEKTPTLTPINNTYALAWNNFATGAVRLGDNSKTQEVINFLKESLKATFPGKRVIVMQGELLGGVESGNRIQLNLSVSDKYWVSSQATAIRNIIESALKDVSVRFQPNIDTTREFIEFIPREKNVRMSGVPDEALKNLIKATGVSDFIGKWSDNGEPLNVFISMKNPTSDLLSIPYVSLSGQKMYVGDLMEVVKSQEPPSLIRMNGMTVVSINLQITNKETSVSDVVDELKVLVIPELKKLLGEKGFVTLEGSAASLSKAKSFLMLMLVFVMLAFLLIVTLVLKSFRLSICVLLSLPTSLFGGLIGFHLLSLISAVDFNVLTIIGFMVMLGIVANNAILLADLINQKYSKGGKSISKALIEGCTERYRAVVISSITTVLGILPLLLVPSEASVIYQGIAAVIVGGIIVNLMTVFIVIPSAITTIGLTERKLTKENNINKNILDEGVAL